MKKLIFTAIAMVAFSGVSMAGDIAEEKSVQVLLARDCVQEGLNARDCAYEAGVDFSKAEEIGECVQEKCEAETAPKGPVNQLNLTKKL